MQELYRHLPKKHQIFLLRNWGKLSIEKMSSTLSCSIVTVAEQAEILGLPDCCYDEIWMEKGYLTIIRNNWDLLTLEQIANLFDWSVEKLEKLLIEEDFFLTKLGGYRNVQPLTYKELSPNEKLQTEQIGKIISKYFDNSRAAEPFEFYAKNNFELGAENKRSESIKISFSYSMLFGDIFMDEPELSFPDEMLARYKNIGINGLWLPIILYQFNPLFFDKTYTTGYKTRIKNLNIIIERAAKHGIKIYLYINEPRGMPTEFFDSFPELKGTYENNMNAFCTSNQRVRDYLKNGIKYLCENALGIGGFITITMSENLTNCYSRVDKMCEVCAKRDKVDVIAEVNNLIYEGITSAKSQAKLIVWNWGWTAPKWSMEDNKKVLDKLPNDVFLMCVSEDELEFEKGNVKGNVIDYSISNVGPSEKSRELFEYARKTGRQTMAKIQINNSWECSFVPYIPVFNLVVRHLRNLYEIGVDNMMTCWSLGGYPSPGLDLINADFSKSDEEILQTFYKNTYNIADDRLNEAISLLSSGFENFPFSLCILYNGTQNYNISNLLYINKTGMNASMIGFCYDDLASWIYPYKYEDYIALIEKLLENFNKGIALINEIEGGNTAFDDLKRITKAVYIAFLSVKNQAVFTAVRDDIAISSDKEKEMLTIAKFELSLAEEMLQLQRQDARIGFEASNHYLFAQNNLIEKIVNCNYLIRQLAAKSEA